MNAGIILAVLLVLGVGWLLQRSTLGFRFRMIGANRERGAGCRSSRSSVTSSSP